MENEIELLAFDDSRFSPQRTLQESLFGTVTLEYDHSQNRTVAIKTSDLTKCSLETAVENPYREARLLEWLTRQNGNKGHPNVVRLLSIACDKYDLRQSEDFESDCRNPAASAIRVVLEYVSKGELFSVVESCALGETRARRYFRQIVEAVDWLHSLNVCHLDVSLENILLDSETDSVKLADFGVARWVRFTEIDDNDPQSAADTTLHPADLDNQLEKLSLTEHKAELEDKHQPCLPLPRSPTRRKVVVKEKFRGKPGKPGYQSPELFSGNEVDGRACDVFAMGVLLFTMVVGFPPFQTPDRSDVRYKNIADRGTVGLRHLFTRWNVASVSDSLIELLCHMICAEELRFTVEQVLSHSWLQTV